MKSRLAWIVAQRAPQLLLALALVLLAAAAVLHAVVLPPLARQAEAAGAAAERRDVRRGDDPAAAAARELQAFYRHVEAGSLPDQLAQLHGVARATGIVLRQGDYRLMRESDGRLRRYQATLPVRGPYRGVRQFVTAALRTLPNAALEQVSFQRPRVEDGEVEAQLRLTIYLPEHGT